MHIKRHISPICTKFLRHFLGNHGYASLVTTSVECFFPCLTVPRSHIRGLLLNFYNEKLKNYAKGIQCITMSYTGYLQVPT